MRIVNYLKALWASLPHVVQAILMLFGGAFVGSLGKALSVDNPCYSLHCWRQYIGAAISTGIAAVVALYIPNSKGNVVNKAIALVVFAALLVAPAVAQLSNFYAAGVSYNQGASPSVAGTALFAHAVSDGSGTYAFAVYDALPASYHPFTVTSNVGIGVAQKLFSIGNNSVYVPTSAGVSFNGSNTGWAWSTGAMVPIKVSSKHNWYIAPTARVIKSSVNNQSGYQPVFSVLFGWGQ